MSSERGRTTSSAVLVYVILLVSVQVFLITVAVEAFQSDNEPVAWATAIVSVVLAASAALFLRYLRP
ncbi:MAG: hypothetical protein EHM63_00155 [Actinobacteria bacterium]|nr:MAG: hypothetical protein EHM63_00155 [Actinomycetota bacterium]